MWGPSGYTSNQGTVYEIQSGDFQDYKEFEDRIYHTIAI